jgi:putative oxidoreductase
MRKLLFLNSAQRFGDFALLLLRLFVGLFLIWGVWDNITSSERMAEFAGFLVYTQFLVGCGFVLGLFTRWAGILCVITFTVAIVMVDRHLGFRGTFPSGCLVLIGLYLATHGAGRFSIDSAMRANETPRATGGVRLKR